MCRLCARRQMLHVHPASNMRHPWTGDGLGDGGRGCRGGFGLRCSRAVLALWHGVQSGWHLASSFRRGSSDQSHRFCLCLPLRRGSLVAGSTWSACKRSVPPQWAQTRSTNHSCRRDRRSAFPEMRMRNVPVFLYLADANLVVKMPLDRNHRGGPYRQIRPL